MSMMSEVKAELKEYIDSRLPQIQQSQNPDVQHFLDLLRVRDSEPFLKGMIDKQLHLARQTLDESPETTTPVRSSRTTRRAPAVRGAKSHLERVYEAIEKLGVIQNVDIRKLTGLDTSQVSNNVGKLKTLDPPAILDDNRFYSINPDAPRPEFNVGIQGGVTDMVLRGLKDFGDPNNRYQCSHRLLAKKLNYELSVTQITGVKSEFLEHGARGCWRFRFGSNYELRAF